MVPILIRQQPMLGVSPRQTARRKNKITDIIRQTSNLSSSSITTGYNDIIDSPSLVDKEMVERAIFVKLEPQAENSNFAVLGCVGHIKPSARLRFKKIRTASKTTMR
jgi:hypothetical protein